MKDVSVKVRDSEARETHLYTRALVREDISAFVHREVFTPVNVFFWERVVRHTLRVLEDHEESTLQDNDKAIA